MFEYHQFIELPSFHILVLAKYFVIFTTLMYSEYKYRLNMQQFQRFSFVTVHIRKLK